MQQPLSLAEPETQPLEIFDKDADDFCEELKTLTNTDNEQSELFYERPGKIQNERLVGQSEVTGSKCLKKTLVEYYDYEVVTKAVW